MEDPVDVYLGILFLIFFLQYQFDRSSEMASSKLGTPSYTAPEVLLGDDYCHEVRRFYQNPVSNIKQNFTGRPFLIWLRSV